MKILRSVVLASCFVFGGSVGAQQAKAPVAMEYDAGVCGEQDFMALHVVVSGDKLIINAIATGPKNAHKTPDDVWKFVKADAAGFHFVEDVEGVKYELIVRQDKKDIEGLLYADGKKVAKFYGHVADGKTLQESGAILYQMCLEMWESPSGSPVNKS